MAKRPAQSGGTAKPASRKRTAKTNRPSRQPANHKYRLRRRDKAAEDDPVDGAAAAPPGAIPTVLEEEEPQDEPQPVNPGADDPQHSVPRKKIPSTSAAVGASLPNNFLAAPDAEAPLDNRAGRKSSGLFVTQNENKKPSGPNYGSFGPYWEALEPQLEKDDAFRRWWERALEARELPQYKHITKQDIANAAARVWRRPGNIDWDKVGEIHEVMAPPSDAEPVPINKPEVARTLGGDGLDGHWNFMKTLGVGGGGHAGLWVRVDSRGRIIERVVIKECYHDDWDDPAYWFDMGTRTSREYQIHADLDRLPGAWSLVGLRSYKVYEERRLYRVYLDYCAFGSVHDLMQAHINRQGFKDQDGNAIDHHVPEAMIWNVFYAMATTICLMSHGARPGETSDAWGGPFIHRDLKPDNVFLTIADSDDTTWPGLPRPKVGDFGLSCPVICPEIANPRQMIGAGSYFWMAPEQHLYPETPLLQGRHQINSSADVWGIGKTMLALMQCEWSGQSRYDGPQLLVPQQLRRHYSNALVDLLQLCLQWQPKDRIAIEDLLNRIMQEIRAYPQAWDTVPILFRKLRGAEQVFVKPDIYPLFAPGTL